MSRYTISVMDENGYSIPLKRAKDTRDNFMQAAWNFSQHATLCDVVVTCGSKHVVTYRDGKTTRLNGKER